jgi:predicted DNA-binding transcriptional regulator AlpA
MKPITMGMMPATREKIELILEIDQTVTKEERKHFNRGLRAENGNTRRTLITTKEACEILGVSSMTLSRYEKRGYLSPIRYTQRKIRWDRDDIYDFLNNGAKAA